MQDVPFIPSDISPEDPALLDDVHTEWITYGALKKAACDFRDGLCSLTTEPRLLFLFVENSIDGAVAFLGGLAAGRCVALLNPSLPQTALDALIEIYRPDEIIAPKFATEPEGYRKATDHRFLFLRSSQAKDVAPSEKTKILLSTSGSTGSPKFVRLTLPGLIDNAHAIAEALDIKASDIGCAHLQIDYSYGLSILTSHLVRGARVLLTRKTFVEREFWDRLRTQKITHLPGVPYHYQMLKRLRFEKLDVPSLRTMTQAGGRLDLALQQEAHDFMVSRGGRFYVMYGQTEASPRITTLPHDRFEEKKGSAGCVIGKGELEVLDGDGKQLGPNKEGEVVYRGANVMLGYAQSREDLALPDQLFGVLPTGDIGFLDQEGFLFITGRAKRFGKVYGWRVNLDEIEKEASKLAKIPVAVEQVGETLHVCLSKDFENDENGLIDHLASRFALPRHVYRISKVDALPLTPNGKIDYRKLHEWL